MAVNGTRVGVRRAPGAGRACAVETAISAVPLVLPAEPSWTFPASSPRGLSWLGPGTDAEDAAIPSSLPRFPREEVRQTPQGAHMATQSACCCRALAHRV